MSWEFRNDQAIYPQLHTKNQPTKQTPHYPAGSKLPSVRE